MSEALEKRVCNKLAVQCGLQKTSDHVDGFVVLWIFLPILCPWALCRAVSCLSLGVEGQ